MASRMLCCFLVSGLTLLAGCRAAETVHITNHSSHIVRITGTTTDKPISLRLEPGEEMTAEFKAWHEYWINEHYVVIRTAMLNEAGEETGPEHVRYILNNGPHTYEIVDYDVVLPTHTYRAIRARSGSWLSAPPGCLSEGERARVAPGVEW